MMNKKYIYATIAIFIASIRISISQVKSLLSYFIRMPKEIREFINYNTQKKGNLACQTGFILMDIFDIPQWIISNSIFIRELTELYQAEPISYSSSFRTKKLRSLYKSFGVHRHALVRLKPLEYLKVFGAYFRLVHVMRNADDLINLKLDGIFIGIDVYETTLANSRQATIVLPNISAYVQLYRGLIYFKYMKRLMSSSQIKALCLSHDCYVDMGIPAKIAQASGIPVYFANPFSITLSRKSHDIYNRFLDYSSYFSKTDKSARTELIARSKKALNNRISGGLNQNMYYQKLSAFSSGGIKTRQTRATATQKVVIATHCFYDNPHAYGLMNFRDFYEWLDFTGEHTKDASYELYIKPHRDYLKGTLEILTKLCKRYPHITLVDPSTSFHQLRQEGVTHALTCYGSIGHELPLLGITVINAAYNPHTAFDFNINCANLTEYKNCLKLLPELKMTPERIDQIYQFYATHYFICRDESLLFDDYSKLFDFVGGDITSPKVYSYFLGTMDGDGSKPAYSETARRFIKSGIQYHFEL